MRVSLLLFFLPLVLVACETPPRRPPPLPTGPDAVDGCRSSPIALGGVRYSCSSYVVFDNLLEAGSIRAIERDLVTSARAKGIDATARFLDVAGAEDAVIIDYQQAGGHSFDLVALHPVDTRSRMLQCHMPWFESIRSRPRREENCTRTIGLLLQRPPPAGQQITAECKAATRRLPTLPGRVDPPDHSEALRSAMREFATTCTDKIAACALAAKSYVEATLCWSN